MKAAVIGSILLGTIVMGFLFHRIHDIPNISIYSPTPTNSPVPIDYILKIGPIQDNNPSSWLSATWESFSFKYPRQLQLAEGGFAKNNFSLNYGPSYNVAIRLYGRSVDPEGKSFKQFNSDAYRTDQVYGYPGYKLETSKQTSTGVYIRTFTFSDIPTVRFRMYEAAKYYDHLIRYLVVIGDTENWAKNQGVMGKIIDSIEY